MTTFKTQTTRKETKNAIKTAVIFEYGNGYRVKYTVTDTDKNATHVLSTFDKEYTEQAQAEQAYEDILDFMELP